MQQAYHEARQYGIENMKPKKTFIGNEALQKEYYLNLKYPILNGIIVFGIILKNYGII